ncbi:molybdopterin cofactor-binding domain-containing protein [Mitsuaria sp. GD03876]|uniref:xanthine dehydrogenase family protein molybdopterin-binding subunit n=1 Tax=Mitsuaria sp. GD03876 TaxID=2975399 RepID=UPI00244AEC7E|nr:molybdopterin cofactor-binding domain-containing protein [Mitsuaria sp. GD03876]MDH0867524.1 molybdopterin-dependent oxidoreductase [Mitsuaria sp. GD03876]
MERRQFLKIGAGTGGAFVASFALPLRAVKAAPAAPAAFEPSVYIRIAPSGQVTYVIPFVEMGQGSFTAIPMMLAEEMDVPLAGVVVEQAPADERRYANPVFGMQITGGSASMIAAWKAVRTAGATCRAMLVSAAADTWQCGAQDCATQAGKVVQKSTGKQLSYGQLAGKAAALPVPKDVPPKDPRQYRLVGTPARRLDMKAKSDGSAKFGIDTRLPGMKVAAIAHCPVAGGKVRRVDDARARAVRGVRQVLVADDIVGVVADHYGAARKGLAALVVDWDEGPNAGFSTQAWKASVRDALKRKGIVSKQEGDFAAAKAAPGTRLVEVEYDAPTMVHAPLEPMNCTLHFHDGGCEVWLGTQAPVKVQQAVAAASGVAVEKIQVHNFLIGGGFGRRLDAEYVGQAAKLAKQVNFPLKVVYSREEDIRHGSFRPLYCDEMAATLDTAGRITGFSHRLSGSSIVARYAPQWLQPGVADPDAVEAAETPYSIPARIVEYVAVEPPAGYMTAFWRGVGPNHNAWAVEGFMDELAVTAKADPVAFRLAHLGGNPRLKAVLETAAAKSGWGGPLPPRAGRGVAVLNAWGSYIAMVIELGVGNDGAVNVRRVTTAIDCGIAVNPDSVMAQMEGGHVFGLTAVMLGQLTIDQGRVQQSNFHDFPLMRIDQTPRMDIHLTRSLEEPGGVGEIGTAIAAPAYINALYAATGKRFRSYPVAAEELKA